MAEEEFLSPASFVDSDHPKVMEFAEAHKGPGTTDMERALSLFYAVRDGIRYDPYMPLEDPASYRASDAVISGRGWCVPKSALLTACARLQGIPARPGYADVVNHLATPRLIELVGTDVFFYHSYCELFLEGEWVKCTPAFNKTLCDKFGLKPLDFDGRNDSLFHEFDQVGNRHMEYTLDRGHRTDVPFDEIIALFRKEYKAEYLQGVGGDFQAEAESQIT
ncbi:MAG: transglutaminase family protein [Rhodospirillales bacterium]|jgi:transglutaminase-like putative cysteine protease|nr:transglutaminase family protein [Rhodospirillales bacterium]